MNKGPRITIRNEPKPGDMGYLVYLHGYLYSAEYGFDSSFESYVVGPLSAFMQSRTDRERIWIVEHEKEIVGSVAITKYSDQVAQLRWFLVHPRIRGHGIGKRLVGDAIEFCRDNGYSSVFLWTEDILKEAGKLYESFGFRLAEENARRMWGIELKEQKYELVL